MSAVNWRQVGLQVRNSLPIIASYLVLSVLMSWPLAAQFTHGIPPGDDPRHNLWVLWHVREWLVGHQPLFDLPLLYYPYGASLLTHGLGPVTGIFALPFWGLGYAAAHNGAVLVSLTLTGYCMYLLARDMGMDRGVAFFAGALLLTAPMCLAGLLGHMTKVFLGALPLTVLLLRRALDPERSAWWALGPAAGLLLLLLHAGYQFVAGAALVGLLMLLQLAAPERGNRRTAVRRIAAVALASIVLVVPQLVAIQLEATSENLIQIGSQAEAYSPDLVHMLVPYYLGRLVGPQVRALLQPYPMFFSADTAVWLSWVALVLVGFALFWRAPEAWRWGVVLAVFVALSLGPVLHVLGGKPLAALGLPMPYSLVASLPGLSFMRVPGRFMMAGYVALATLGGLGLGALLRRFPRFRLPLLGGLGAAHLLLIWPLPWPHQPLLPIPAFYEQIATDPERYGVFDLPYQGMPEARLTGWGAINFAARYQIFQMTHQKGIAGGYLSRSYDQHPLFPQLMSGADPQPPDLWVDGAPANGLANAEADLARYGYRYVVVHHSEAMESEQLDPAFVTLDKAYMAEQSAAFVRAVFGSRQPIMSDELADVYAIDPAAPFTTTIGLLRNWYGRPDGPDGHRWGISPAELYVAAPKDTPAFLELLPNLIHDPESPNGLGAEGVLRVEDGTGAMIETPIKTGVPLLAPVILPAGGSVLTLTLAAGNFTPHDYGSSDRSVYSFLIDRIALHTVASFGAAPDLLIDGQQQLESSSGYAMAFHGGWYGREAQGTRWAEQRAELLIYSPTTGEAALSLLPAILYTPDGGPFGNGPSPLIVRSADAPEQTVMLRVGERSEFPLRLHAGWNHITFEHTVGAFRPADVDASSNDTRSLSFALAEIQLVPGNE